jgi:xylan 1,4-beta-xylosidase
LFNSKKKKLRMLLGLFVYGVASEVVLVDTTAGSTPFDHYWTKSFGSGHATLTLRDDWQAHLKQAQADLGLQGVRHHGLFDGKKTIVASILFV